MNIALLLLALSVPAAAAASEPPPDRGTLEMLDAPGGKVVAILLPGTAPKTLEQREGYARVAVEGWIRIPAGGPAAPVPVPPPNPAPEVAAGPALSGRIQTLQATGETRPAAYARLALLSQSEELDRGREALDREYRAERESLEGKIRELEAAGKQSLNSSDNMTEAARRSDQIRAELVRRRKELGEIDSRYTVRAEDLYRKHQVAETVADPGGRFSFSSLPPGRYRIWVAVTDSGGTRHWYVPAEVPVGGGGRVELTGTDADRGPF